MRKRKKECCKSGCYKLITEGSYCKEHSYNKGYNNIRQALYSTSAWQKLRKEKLRNKPVCELCEIQGITKRGSLVHHRIPVESDIDKALDYENLQTLCHECHANIHKCQNGGGL